jgi:uncharacterized protein
MNIDYFSIIQKYISPDSKLFRFYVVHVTLVTKKALSIAGDLELSEAQRQFIEEAAMLHDIGISQVKNETLGCTGELPYICHGIEGRRLLEEGGLPQHALVCERHTGVGVTKEEIVARKLPLPHRDMLPISLEEKIICYADLFYSKSPAKLWQEKTLEQVEKDVVAYGKENIKGFEALRKVIKQ